jgi:hypothetical protein
MINFVFRRLCHFALPVCFVLMQVYGNAQKISTCSYPIPSFRCTLDFACGASIDSSRKNELMIYKEIKNSSGELIAFIQWKIFKSKASEDFIFKEMVRAEQEFMKQQKFRLSAGTQEKQPDSKWIACPDSIYCARFEQEYVNDQLRNFTSYNYVNYSSRGIAFFRFVYRKNQGYSKDDFFYFRDKLYWHRVPPFTVLKNRLRVQLPAGIFDGVELNDSLFIFKWNVRDSVFLNKSTYIHSDITVLKEYIRIHREGFNTVAAIKTLEKQITDAQKKKGWDCFPGEKIILPGSAASEISMIKSFRSYKDQYGSWDNDSCVYYILAFQDSREKKNIPPNIRTIFIVYVPLREGSWYRSIEAATRQRILAELRPVYQ